MQHGVVLVAAFALLVAGPQYFTNGAEWLGRRLQRKFLPDGFNSSTPTDKWCS